MSDPFPLCCACLVGPRLSDLEAQYLQARRHADALEVRCDLIASDALEPFLSRLRSCPLPWILTDHHASEARKEALAKLATTYRPHFVDCRYPDDSHLLQALSPQIPILLSYHDFESMPPCLETHYKAMQQFFGKAAHYKIAVTPKTSANALSALQWAHKKKDARLTLTLLGKEMEWTRPLTRTRHMGFLFAACQENTLCAPGQLSLETLYTTYRLKKLSANTRIYALLGSPISSSIGHIYHNGCFEKAAIDALYLKIPVHKEDLADFFKVARSTVFNGFSVTMPHKEAVIPLLDHLSEEAKAIGAVNTIISKGGLMGHNTDGQGAMNALEKVRPVRSARLLILGNGGTAKAIAYEGLRRGAQVCILSRKKGDASLPCSYDLLSNLQERLKEADFLIQATSVGFHESNETLVPKELLRESLTVMDVIAQETQLLRDAKEKGCQTLPGKTLFLEQAALQQKLWLVSS